MILKKWRKLTTRDVKAGWRLVSSSLSLVSERGGLVLVVVERRKFAVAVGKSFGPVELVFGFDTAEALVRVVDFGSE